MTRFLVQFKRDSEETNRYEYADDAPALLHKLGRQKILDQVFDIWECRKIEFDISYYQGSE